MYLRIEPAPAWFDVERALATLGFSDTENGRRQFDEFVMSVDLDAQPLFEPEEAAPAQSMHRVPKDRTTEFSRIVELARQVARLDKHELLLAKSVRATTARRLIVAVATHDLGGTYAWIASQLGLHKGSVANLATRPWKGANRESLLAELRTKLARASREK